MSCFAHLAVFYCVEHVAPKQSLLTSLLLWRVASKVELSFDLIYSLLGLTTHGTSIIIIINSCFPWPFRMRVGRSTRWVGWWVGCSHLWADSVVKSPERATDIIVVTNGILHLVLNNFLSVRLKAVVAQCPSKIKHVSSISRKHALAVL